MNILGSVFNRLGYDYGYSEAIQEPQPSLRADPGEPPKQVDQPSAEQSEWEAAIEAASVRLYLGTRETIDHAVRCVEELTARVKHLDAVVETLRGQLDDHAPGAQTRETFDGVSGRLQALEDKVGQLHHEMQCKDADAARLRDKARPILVERSETPIRSGAGQTTVLDTERLAFDEAAVELFASPRYRSEWLSATRDEPALELFPSEAPDDHEDALIPPAQDE